MPLNPPTSPYAPLEYMSMVTLLTMSLVVAALIALASHASARRSSSGNVKSQALYPHKDPEKHLKDEANTTGTQNVAQTPTPLSRPGKQHCRQWYSLALITTILLVTLTGAAINPTTPTIHYPDGGTYTSTR